MKKLLLLLLIVTSHNVHAEPANAAKLCMMIQSTGVLTSDCIVDLFNQRVIVQMSAGKEKAKEVCKNLKKTMIVYKSYFDKGWTLHIMNYPNTTNRLAMCHLPTQS